MKKAFLCVFLISTCLNRLVIECMAQSYLPFIDEYIFAFNARSDTYNDTTLFYIPVVMNLGEFDNHWYHYTISQRRSHLWDCLRPPVLADDMAININTKERYSFPTGMISHNGQYGPSIIVGPIHYYNWYYYEVQIPLTNYLRVYKPDYLFSVINLGYPSNIPIYVAIQGKHMSFVIYSNYRHEFYSVDAEHFTQNVEDAFFNSFLEDNCE